MTQRDLQCIMCKELEAAVQEGELKEAHDHLRAVLKVEYVLQPEPYETSCEQRCPWCDKWDAIPHAADCPRQAAQAYLDGLQ